MNYDVKECAKRIRQLRIQNGLTQEQMATSLRIDQSFYARIETGKRGCPVDIFVQLFDLFGVSLDYLILGKSDNRFPSKADTAQLKSDIEALIDTWSGIKLPCN